MEMCEVDKREGRTMDTGKDKYSTGKDTGIGWIEHIWKLQDQNNWYCRVEENRAASMEGGIRVAEGGWDQGESQREGMWVDVKEHKRIHKFYTKGMIRTDIIRAHRTKVFSYPKWFSFRTSDKEMSQSVPNGRRMSTPKSSH